MDLHQLAINRNVNLVHILMEQTPNEQSIQFASHN